MIRYVITLAVACVMLSPPAFAKRFKTMEAYYAWRNSHHYLRQYHHRSRVREARASLPRVSPLGDKPPVLYQYAVGNAVFEVKSGSTPYLFDRFCNGPVQWVQR